MAGFLDAIGLGQPDPADRIDPETQTVYMGGDPVMGQVARGHDFSETNAAQAEIEQLRKAKGRPLTQAETAAVLARHPSADASLATGPTVVQDAAEATTKAVKEAARKVGSVFGGIWTVLKWVGVAVVAILALALFLRVRGK